MSKRKGKPDKEDGSKEKKQKSDADGAKSTSSSSNSNSSNSDTKQKNANDVLMKPNAATETKDRPPNVILDDGGYFTPEGKESWLWKHAKLHNKYPGKFQCQVDGCCEWRAFSIVGNVRNHLSKGKHAKWWQDNAPEAEKKQSQDPDATGRTKTKQSSLDDVRSPGKMTQFLLFLTLWIGCSFRPFSCVEDPFFIDMIRSVTHPKFTVPTSNTIRDDIVRHAKKLKDKVLLLACQSSVLLCFADACGIGVSTLCVFDPGFLEIADCHVLCGHNNSLDF
jgi:hypothetical protein